MLHTRKLALLAALAGVPYVVLAHGVLMQWSMGNRRRWLKRLSWSLIESRVLLRSRRRAIYFRPGNARSTPIRWMSQRRIDPVSSRPARVRSEPRGISGRVSLPLGNRMIALFLSRLDPKKGLDLLRFDSPTRGRFGDSRRWRSGIRQTAEAGGRPAGARRRGVVDGIFSAAR